MVHKLKKTAVFRRLAVICLLLVGMIGSLTMPAEAASVSDFTDVASNAWYYDAVSYVAKEGLFAGTSATTFTPGGTMTRGMFITVLGRLAGVDPAKWCTGFVDADSATLYSAPSTSASALATVSMNKVVTILGTSGSFYKVSCDGKEGYIWTDSLRTYSSFSDVDYGAYYAGYVIWGHSMGIVDGVSPTSFAPNANVTREQICKLLAGYADYAGITLKTTDASVSFTDRSSISSWATESVALMQWAGVVMGEPDGSGYRFRPKSSATRAEAAAIFQRFSTAGLGNASDTPATIIGGTISVPTQTIRVGIAANSKSYKNAVQTATLTNTNGSSFEYGTFSSDRAFQKAGTISSATVTVTLSGSTFTVKNASGSVVLTTGGALALRPVSSGKALTRVNGDYRYFGDFELRPAYNASGYIAVINYVNIEDYVKGVIPYEFSPAWPTETLKATAIAARNIGMAADWSLYSSFGFDVLATSNLQTYRGRGKSYAESYFAASDAAVDATKGLYLTYNDKGTRRLCNCVYFSSDGGATEDSAHVFGVAYSYLIGKVDPYEAAAASLASYYEKTITVSRTGTALTNLAKNAGLGSTTIAKNGISIATYPVTGNVKNITLTGTNGKTVLIDESSSFTRWNFLTAVGFTAYSYRFDVTYNASDDTFTITRHGWGHNVGMSSWGAYSMALNYNKSYQDILGFYYTGTSLQYGE